MTRDEAIIWVKTKIVSRLYNPKEEDVQALNIALHDMTEINKLGKSIEFWDKKGEKND